MIEEIISYSKKPTKLFRTHGVVIHSIAMGILIGSLVFPLAFQDVLYLTLVLLVIIPPGLLLLGSLEKLAMPFPFMLGGSIAIGLMLQGLLSFVLTIAYIPGYYQYAAVIISLVSIVTILVKKEPITFNTQQSSFDLVDLTLYLGLYLGFGLYASTYGNLFDSRILEGLIETPLLERHSIGFANYALNYTEYPFFTIFGWPIIPVEIPYKIPHLPMLGFLVKSLSAWCGGNLLFALYLVHLLAFLSLVFITIVISTLLFNRYAALVVSVAFSLHLMPIDRSYLLYLPVLMSLMGAAVFVLIVMNLDAGKQKANIRMITLMCIVTVFLMLAHNQFLMVFSASLIAYLLLLACRLDLSQLLKTYGVPLLFITFAFFIALQQNKTLYPSLFATPWDNRLAVIELSLFRNVGYVYDSINVDFKSFIKTLLRYDFFLVVSGAIALFTYIRSVRLNHRQMTHVFIMAGILISLLFGNIFDFKAGNSSILFLPFGMYFLIMYGGELLSRKKIIALTITWMIIIGFASYPKYYRFRYCGNGSLPKQEYLTLRKIAEQLPADAGLLLLSNTFYNLYIGHEDEPLPQNYERRTQRACEVLTAHRCVFIYANKTSKNASTKNIQQKIYTYKLTHILTDDPFKIPESMGENISTLSWKELPILSDQKLYLSEITNDRHFY